MNRNGLRAPAAAAALAFVAVTGGVLLDGRTGGVVVLAVLGLAVALALLLADRVTLAAMRARPVGEVEYPQLYREVRELSQVARLPVPRIWVSPALPPHSFAVGRSRRSAAVCCTEGLLRLLTPDELRGVLAHELAHIRARDTAATSFCAGLTAVITSLASPAWLARGRRAGWASAAPARGPALGTARLGFLPPADLLAGAARPGTRADAEPAGAGVAVAAAPVPVVPALAAVEPEPAGWAAALAMLVVGPLAALLLQLSVSRRREYRADALGATLSGDPLALARALRKIEAQTVAMPLPLTGPLASASPLMFVNPFSGEGATRLFSTHPPTRERVFRLEGLAGYPR
ncbi:MAG TPA: M48 family metalloprotease [Streptosporangiaceae bacterium]|nr:M48 family metalloprotease [Streptosporangiaceae bacterium]